MAELKDMKKPFICEECCEIYDAAAPNHDDTTCPNCMSGKVTFYTNPEYRRMHDRLGCLGCRWCEEAARHIRPCCQYAGMLQVSPETGRCLIREDGDMPPEC